MSFTTDLSGSAASGPGAASPIAGSDASEGSASPKLTVQRTCCEFVIADPDVGLEVLELDDRLVAGLHVLRDQFHRLIAIVVRIDLLDVLGGQLLEQLSIQVVDLAAQGDKALLVYPGDAL